MVKLIKAAGYESIFDLWVFHFSHNPKLVNQIYILFINFSQHIKMIVLFKLHHAGRKQVTIFVLLKVSSHFTSFAGDKNSLYGYRHSFWVYGRALSAGFFSSVCLISYKLYLILIGL